jgi:hypothetical protein
MCTGANDSGIDNETLAAFLVVRPPIAFIGWGWESDDRQWDDRFLMQPGVPVGLCVEASRGVFSREWSNGQAELDCNRWRASLPFPSLAAPGGELGSSGTGNG